MASRTSNEDGPAAAMVQPRPAPAARGSGSRHHSLTALSGHGSVPNWSFARAPRFPGPKKSTSSPSLSAATTAYHTGKNSDAGSEDGDAEYEHLEDQGEGPKVNYGANTRANWAGGWKVGGVSRFDGSAERFLDVQEHIPKPKHYDPSVTTGQDTSLLYDKQPLFSFGGGKSRLSDFEPKRVAPPKVEKKMKVDLASQKTNYKIGPKKAMSRGFGTAPRIRHRDSILDLPFSPGPAGYEVPRDHDLAPQWSESSLVPWGKRTERRKELKNPTASSVGPGEHIADHPFQAHRPSPLFAHPVRELTKDVFPSPGDYEQPWLVGTECQYSVGKGDRSDFTGVKAQGWKPGPGQYYPEPEAVEPESYHATFGHAQRTNEVDLIDPDEPPGPGAHTVRKEPGTTGGPNVGMPKDVKLKKTPGLGPDTPGPGTYQFLPPKAHSRTVSLPLNRPCEDFPGPCDYRPELQLTQHAGPEWGSLHRTEARPPKKKLPKQDGTASKQVPYTFEIRGPRYSMPGKRPLPSKVAPFEGFLTKQQKEDMCHTMYAARSSFG